MEKEDVIIEEINNGKVGAILFDKETKSMTGAYIDILDRHKAYIEYNVIGETHDGMVKLNYDEEEDEYTDFFGDLDDED